MTPDEHLVAFDVTRAGLRKTLTTGDAFAAIAGCPGWSLTDLGYHLGTIYRFALEGLQGRTGIEEQPQPDVSMISWFDSGANRLAVELHRRAADWSAPAWTMGEPKSAAFWARRMHHETALHLWDAESALGLPVVIDDASAADGIDEIATMFFPRQIRLGRIASPEATIAVIAHGHPPILFSGTDSGSLSSDVPNATLHGPASELLLALWKRAPLESDEIVISGDAAVAHQILTAAITP